MSLLTMQQADTETGLPRQAQHTMTVGNAAVGDIVTVQLELTPDNGFVPEPLFDTSGKLSFVLGWGNYLPGVHELIEGMRIGESRKNVSIDGGWGKRNPDLVIEVPKANLKELKNVDTIEAGMVLNLKGGIQVSVLSVTNDTIVVDANHPMAGASYSCQLTVLNIERFPLSNVSFSDIEDKTFESPYNVATFALGCFWGGELAFMRVHGVVGTKVGYTQGVTVAPTYEEVCEGSTSHREAVMVVYDSRVVSYNELLEVYMGRLAATSTPRDKMNPFVEEHSSKQYQHGVYFHNDEQRCIAEDAVSSNNNKFNVELKQASAFYDAEPYHQQYLLKGGQPARKGSKETIRCFG